MTYSVWGSFGSNVPTRDVFATETFAVLRLLTPPPSTLNTSIEVDGGVAKGDGLGGIFYYDPASVLADDAVNTIAPTPVPTAGRWRRLLINVGFAVVTGGVVFGAGNVLAQDAANFFWDNAAKKLKVGPIGIGVTISGLGLTINPGNILGITGAGSTNVTIVAQDATSSLALDIRNSSTGASIFSVVNNGPVTASTSVVTPLVGTGPGTTTFGFGVNGLSQWAVDGLTGALYPTTTNNFDFGKPANTIRTVFTPIIDSGGIGSLSLKNNNGETIATFIRQGVSANNWQISSNVAGSPPILDVVGSDADVSLWLRTKGTGSHTFFTAAGTAAQFQVLHTASASRNITVTGSNGGNSVLNTTAGGIDISPATVRFPGIGTTAVAANATLNAVGSNDLLRSTSSQRYKKDWRNLEDADLEILDTIRTIKYKSLSEQDDPDLIHYGMLAEDVFKLNKNLVTFNTVDVGFDLDVPDWVQYERFIPLIIEQRRRDVKRIEALEAKLGIH